jgi:glycerophosphoryl diester phosphodiesterase
MSYVIAHRGASFDAPENTLAAFRLAWEQGADGIEGDFMLSADGQIVCLHDLDTQRLTGEMRIVKQSSLVELQSLDVGRWKGDHWQLEQIPTLTEVFAAVPAGKKIVAELKDGPEIVEPFAEALAASTFDCRDALIISLVDETIAECKRQLPHIKRHWLSGYKQDEHNHWRPTADEVIATIERVGAAGFGSMAMPEHFDGDFIHKLRTAGIDEFHVWTVDDPDVARFYANLCAWGITTNRPELVRRELES